MECSRKRKFNPLIQNTIIHTMFDLINSVFEANIYLEDENKNFLYEIITTRLSVKLNHLYNDKDLMSRIEEESNKKIRTDTDTKKISYVVKKVNFIEPSEIGNMGNSYIDTKEKCDPNIKKLDSKERKKYKNEFNSTTNCPDGQFHKWVFEGDDLVCSLCNQKYSKLNNTLTSTEEDYQTIINQLKHDQFRKLLREYCVSGDLHELDSKNVCSKCKINPDTYKYTSKDLDTFEKNIIRDTNNRQLENIKKIQKNIKNMEKENNKTKKIIKKFNKRYKVYIKIN